jgi:glycerol kinase
MPILGNPRHEAYAQAFFAGLSNGGTQEKAYRAAGYLVTNKNSANACASRLMLTIANRVRELQQEANARIQPQVDLSRERVGRRLDLASRMAEEQKTQLASLSVDGAIEANNEFIAKLERIRDQAQRTLEHADTYTAQA